MAQFILPKRLQSYRPGPAVQLLLGLGFALSVALVFVGPDRLWAQIEGERGIAPVASSSDIEVGGIEVNIAGKTAEDAREAGWKLAQKLAWEKLKGPAMSEDQIDNMVSAIVVEREQIGPRRYIATLGVIFDRARAGQFVGGDGGSGPRSAPMLVIPVLYSGGTAQVFEVRGQWQNAWARFRTGASPIDYVRPAGAGGESLIINAGQVNRRSRVWWRNVLDQFGAADVIMPIARLEREWPGGPVHGTFTARYGPDSTYLDSFTLTAKDEAGVPAMLNQALVRFDQIYGVAFAQGILKPDPTLNTERMDIDPGLAALIAAGHTAPQTVAPAAPGAVVAPSPAATPETGAVSSLTIQFNSPDAKAVDAALASVRGTSGVQSASTTSLAIGGTSVMRAAYAGNAEALAAALRARGWQVAVSGNVLSIRR